jgi:FAS-associated factor 2
LAQRLRAEQDREYQESLRQDRERFEAQERAKSVAIEKDQSEKRQKQLLIQMRQAVRASMPSDITCEDIKAGVPQTQDKEAATSDRVRVLVRLPDGLRLQCSYPRNISCKALYLSIFAHENAPENFTIFTNFPKREIPCNLGALKAPFKEGCDAEAHALWLSSPSDPQTFADLGFSKSETVMVIDLDA